MARKPHPSPAPTSAADRLTDSVTPPAGSAAAHNVWLAGLGALASAQAEGSKAFDALVKQGLALQDQTQALAKEQLAEAAQRVGAIAATSGPLGASRWNALEGLFEQRVARALERLGLPEPESLARLESRIAALEDALRAARPPAKRPPAARRRSS